MTRIVITRLPLISYAVRIHADDSDAWETGFVVSRPWWSLRLFISLLMGKVPGTTWWRSAAAAHFPLAPTVTFERREADGLRAVTLKLRPLVWWKAAAAHLRAYFGLRDAR